MFGEIKDIDKSELLTLKFKVDPEYKDPLLSINAFEEMEVEEFPYYYRIHLGVPIHKEDE